MVTADAMHTQVNTAGWIRDQGGHYVLTSLGNQKTLRRTLKNLPWKKVPSFLSIDTGHGRRVRRTARGRPGTQVGGLPRSGSGSPVRRTRTIKGRKHVEVAYLICSLPMEQARPSRLPPGSKGTGESRTGSTSVRDVVFDEDRHQLRTRNGPEIVAALRNLTIRLIRLAHGAQAAIASTTRSLSRQPKRAIKLITQPTT